jgi:PKHD-type hydroxylase
MPMRFRLEPLLDPNQVAVLRRDLLAAEAPWQPGAETAGWHARQVKRNRQLDRASTLHARLAPGIVDALQGHPLVQAAALPLRVHGLLFSRSGVDEGYGRHVDNAFMAGGRSDLSFTVFLCDPADYEGGELVLESPAGEEPLRCPAGHAVVYPSTLLHRVEPVRSGERLVAVGWIQSRIRSAEQRELLFELDTARRALFRQEGKSEIFDLLSRSYTNLLRMWGE